MLMQSGIEDHTFGPTNVREPVTPHVYITTINAVNSSFVKQNSCFQFACELQ